MSSQTWETIFNAKTPDEKVNLFHGILSNLLKDFFPEKSIKVSQFDKKWFNPTLRNLHRQKQREFVKHRRSEKWLKLNKKFKKL